MDKISRDIAEVVQMPEVKKQFATLGLQPLPLTSEQFARSLSEEIANWSKAVKDSCVKVE